MFHETTSAGLLAWKLENNIVGTTQTAEFLDIISKVWKIFNVNWVGKNIRFKDDYLAPIYPADLRLQYISNVVSWLDNWVNLTFLSGKLTPQTFTSFRHTCEALPLLVKQLSENCGYLSQWFIDRELDNFWTSSNLLQNVFIVFRIVEELSNYM